MHQPVTIQNNTFWWRSIVYTAPAYRGGGGGGGRLLYGVGGAVEVLTCPYPLSVQARPPWDQRLDTLIMLSRGCRLLTMHVASVGLGVRGNVDINIINLPQCSITGPDGTVAKSSANGLVGTEFASWYRLIPRVFKGPVGRCKAAIPSSFSLTSNRVTTNLLS